MGVTEADVKSLEEMAAYLEHGSLCRATGSTNMNSHSRSSPATVYFLRMWIYYLSLHVIMLSPYTYALKLHFESKSILCLMFFSGC